jgi:AcrR family transcriptional regulator
MATRATQLRILQTALELFNEHGTAAISANKIAERSGISKGNLQYHFPTKREIIFAVFQQAIQEMDAGWYRDHLAPSLEHMAAMYVRQLQLILKYRFFYREMADLLRQDPALRKRFADNRERRMRDLEKFMMALQSRGLMRFPPDPRRLRAIIDVTWIVNENWLNYMDYQDRRGHARGLFGNPGSVAALPVRGPAADHPGVLSHDRAVGDSTSACRG